MSVCDCVCVRISVVVIERERGENVNECSVLMLINDIDI